MDAPLEPSLPRLPTRIPPWRMVLLAVGLSLAAVAITAAALTAAGSIAGSADALRQAWSGDTVVEPGKPVATGGLRIESSQENDLLFGRLVGIMDRPFTDVQAALAGPDGWCAVLILDPNIHACRVAGFTVEATLGDSATPVTFEYVASDTAAGYAASKLAAAEGPLGTRDYTVTFEAAPLTPDRTLVQLMFSQRFGLTARLAMAAYFTTTGRKKVGFTVVDRDAQGRPVYVGDLRGGIERNLARYFLAIEANAASRTMAAAQQPEARVRAWIAGTERYPAQLREGPGYAERKVPEVRKQMSARMTGQ